MDNTQPTPHRIGDAVEGGFFAGVVRIGAQLFGMVAAPKAEGETAGAWTTKSGKDLPGTGSYFDGLANTNALAEAGSPIGQWARSLSIAGHTDWYVPSRDELELLYRAFKPTGETNYTWRSGDNPSSVPVGYPYTEAEPARTALGAFGEGGTEAFADEWYWSSTQYSPHDAWLQGFDDGGQVTNDKAYEARARAVRRFLIT
ncbi:DUF1566 domain-containing protein [Methylibium sp.]|uniref:Lcl domain-containing protein n=1 Tax=Methylibium sp. TaxID=2067992 RepID=UPI003BAD61E2